ncbi:HpnM family protein [Rhodospirillum rubrum]|uniref:Toluene tolerance n=1 Tax=Rhodospirillum rubrum (strain ATCC 11170 / ATH 1.1.1 / DSM 467 / LMG 4362 / NCIMB 8255 / S1) TaxID=269796 RepID=Q2RYD4_RHORT|nr:HpnM family protein [Rhodospirillum rubrum]ABC20861.1 Toluene tolerance [Rhodospirillum rubrum ATCC 11170]AEO46528.1 toluene tolerance [Rhodospirillum rubrum F11]MBK5952418.1 toluene tolerance protein [Rhodospirillum rubrum]QXG80563.1 HpnM family protein [Rhodospirillum rubrum]
MSVHPGRSPFSLVVFPLIFGVLLVFSQAVRADETPSQRIEAYHGTLLQVMKEAKTLGVAGRFDRIDPAARATFDFDRMAALVAGPSWRDASAAARARLTEAFTRMSVMTYAKRFTGYSDERFETLGEEPGPRGTTLVRTHIVSSSMEAVDLIYVMVGGKGAPWRVVDILLKGSISELAVRRSEYAALLSSGGVDALSQALETQTAALLKAGG